MAQVNKSTKVKAESIARRLGYWPDCLPGS